MSTENQPGRGADDADAATAGPPSASSAEGNEIPDPYAADPYDSDSYHPEPVAPDADETGQAPAEPDAQEPPVRMAMQYPLTDDDPAKVGDFWLDARLTATPAGMAFVAHEDGGDSVMLILLSEGAACDAAARARFSGEVNAMHIDTVVARGGQGQDDGRMAGRFRSEEDDPQLASKAPTAPWVALAFDGTKTAVDEAARILLAIDLTATPPLSGPAGPDFRLHWIERTGHGNTRLWPLPWPGRNDRAGWVTMLVSFLLMALIAALALLLAILLFQNQPLVDAPQPIPSPASGSGSGSPMSPDPTQSGSGSGSPSPGDGGGPYSQTPSMNQPSGDQSGPGDPSPNPRL
ncbi:hypothetical protein SAMN02745244_01806 [Tessaracoccus bendigoensis DSM 12906]|uniref:Uncharacterized protein n=1 Tax=Tessaracoccus bendigoensis DSM 12906 TaxID=1123357 RepID=A0A1M6GV31_9ACTN|nr:hypothetical protein [Tessaracoccus bendigoensis]SHJ13755.1 hypothetical protein SAMN02745244_01806 [Tessaracoccus bendigoensis DSM 12906]